MYQNGKPRDIDDADIRQVAETFAEDKWYLILYNNKSYLWKLSTVPSKCKRAVAKRATEFKPKCSPGYSQTVQLASHVHLEDIAPHCRSKGLEKLFNIPSLTDPAIGESYVSQTLSQSVDMSDEPQHESHELRVAREQIDMLTSKLQISDETSRANIDLNNEKNLLTEQIRIKNLKVDQLTARVHDYDTLERRKVEVEAKYSICSRQCTSLKDMLKDRDEKLRQVTWDTSKQITNLEDELRRVSQERDLLLEKRDDSERVNELEDELRRVSRERDLLLEKRDDSERVNELEDELRRVSREQGDSERVNELEDKLSLKEQEVSDLQQKIMKINESDNEPLAEKTREVEQWESICHQKEKELLSCQEGLMDVRERLKHAEEDDMLYAVKDAERNWNNLYDIMGSVIDCEYTGSLGERSHALNEDIENYVRCARNSHDVLVYLLSSSTDAQQCAALLYTENSALHK
jgi:hypothetical protein